MKKTVILRDSHQYILKKLPDFIQENFVFSGGTALAEYYCYHRFSDDLDFFAMTKEQKIPIDAILFALRKIGKTTFDKIYDRVMFFVQTPTEKIKIEFVPLYLDRINRPQKKEHGFFVDSIEDITANKILAICDRSEPKDFVDLFFIHKKTNWDIHTMVELAQKKHRQSYRYLLRLNRFNDFEFTEKNLKINTHGFCFQYNPDEIKAFLKKSHQLIVNDENNECYEQIENDYAPR